MGICSPTSWRTAVVEDVNSLLLCQAIPEEAKGHLEDPSACFGGLGPVRPQDPVSLHERWNFTCL